MDSVNILKLQLEAYEQHRDHAVVTIVSSTDTARSEGKMLVYADGTTAGTVGGSAAEALAIRDAREVIRTGGCAVKTYDLNNAASEKGLACGGSLTVLIEGAKLRPLLVMCGGGHVGSAVIDAAKLAGFDTLLLDDRGPELLGEVCEKADRYVKMKPFAEQLTAMDIAPGAYYVVATHSHAMDGAVLSVVLTKAPAYVGMIGSQKKINAIFERMSGTGITREALDQVYTPIGLDLGGETPGEIAISILAEILQVRYQLSGRHMRHC